MNRAALYDCLYPGSTSIEEVFRNITSTKHLGRFSISEIDDMTTIKKLITDNIFIMYYLFDGDIKNCTHPFCVYNISGEIRRVLYFSSELIQKNLPIELEFNHTGECIMARYDGMELLEPQGPFIGKYVDVYNIKPSISSISSISSIFEFVD